MIPNSSRTHHYSELPVHVEVSPVHERTSRRLLGLPAECGPLPDRATKMTGREAAVNVNLTDTPIQYVVQQPRAPKVFHGDTYEDVEDWLDHFERVATFNGWDDNRKRRNVYFSLEDPARTWFENHESGIPS